MILMENLEKSIIQKMLHQNFYYTVEPCITRYTRPCITRTTIKPIIDIFFKANSHTVKPVQLSKFAQLVLV